MHPALQALVICAAAVAAEGALAGPGVRARFAELRQPPHSPSLTVWFIIGAAYYVTCFVLLRRLLASTLPSDPHRIAFFLLLALMAANAVWGWLFFRRKNLRASFLAFLPYGFIGIALGAVLVVVDRTSAVLLAPYLLYLGYAAWWSYRLWALNRPLSANGFTGA